MIYMIVCGCGCTSGNIAASVVNDASLAVWRTVCDSITQFTCASCGCAYHLTDNTTSIDTMDVSCPRIDSIDASTGPAAGGATVNITGHRLDLSGVIVKFDGMAATPTSVSSALMAVTTPAHGAGVVNVTVEGAFGMRPVGSTLVGAYTYT